MVTTRSLGWTTTGWTSVRLMVGPFGSGVRGSVRDTHSIQRIQRWPVGATCLPAPPPGAELSRPRPLEG
eukprot:5093665-Alexandrium_andersonii.AAC.1